MKLATLKKITLTLALSFVQAPLAFSSTLSVQPLYLEFVKNKKTRKEKFEITVSSEKNKKVKLDIYKAFQEKSGKLSFVQEDNSKDMIELKKNSYTVRANKPLTIEGFINFPKDKNKTFLYALMIEEDKSNTSSGVSINVRYAVILKVNSSHRKSKIEADLYGLSVQNIDGKLVLKSSIRNSGMKDFYIKAKAKIRDEKNQLIETVDIRSASAWQRKDPTSIIFPQSEVELVGGIENIYTPGTYSISIHGKIDNRKSISQTQKVQISEEMIPKEALANQKKKIRVDPEFIEIKTKKNATKYQKFMIRNDGAQTIDIGFPTLLSDKSGNIEYIFVPSQVQLRPGSKKNIMIKASTKKEGVFKVDDLTAVVTDTKGNFIKNLSIPLTVHANGGK